MTAFSPAASMRWKIASLSAGRVWNRIPDDIRENIIDLALDEPELSPRELAVTFTDTRGYFVSESSVYRLLKAQDLITSPCLHRHQGCRRVP
jgi:hypothetical protein